MDKREKLDRLSDEIIGVLVRAHKQAKLCGQSVVGTEFVLLVLLAEKNELWSEGLQEDGNWVTSC